MAVNVLRTNDINELQFSKNVFYNAKDYVVGVHIIQVRLRKVGSHRPIVVAVDSDGLANIILKGILTTVK